MARLCTWVVARPIAAAAALGVTVAGCELALGTSSLTDRSGSDGGGADATANGEGGGENDAGLDTSTAAQTEAGSDGQSLESGVDGGTTALGDGSVPDTGACSPTAAPDTATGVFVSPSGTDAGTCGTATSPCTSIAAALAVLTESLGSKTTVYVDNGVYPEALALPAGATIQGGWQLTGSTWKRECPVGDSGVTGEVTVQAPAGSDTTVSASYSGASTLDTLTIKGAATVPPSGSQYGVFASGSGTQLTLVNVAISLGNAGAGDAGAPGASRSTAAAPAFSTSDNYGTCAPGDGGAGSAGGPGTAGTAGAFSASGFVPGNGGNGIPGGPGQDGTAGGQGYTSQNSTPGSCIATTMSCSGGGTTGCYCAYTYNYCADNGYSGCGAQGAGAGSAGAGGGSSIGLYVWNAAVTIENISIVVGNGGNGGSGGGAGTAGAGSAGASSSGPAQSIYVGCTTSTTQNCGVLGTCSLWSAYQGAAGGKGGNGGASGPGGGGAGGDSYCYVTGGTGTVTAAGGSCSPGSGGVGGNQGQGNQGATGSAGVHN